MIVIAGVEGDAVSRAGLEHAAQHIERGVAVEGRDLDRHLAARRALHAEVHDAARALAQLDALHRLVELARVEADVPLAEMFGYSTELRSATQGKAEFTMEFARYTEVPSSVSEALKKKYADANRIDK